MSEITEMKSQGLEFSQGANHSEFTEIGPQKDGGEEFYHRGVAEEINNCVMQFMSIWIRKTTDKNEGQSNKINKHCNNLQ